ncbi:hypothetical protein V5O48_011121 [Marasmius crinis-equi]|uniref:Protein kinase domain-containing protein n=1 Tax=Marasmius crinis-equi TaxID=585013 RepID=A0ABR3F6I4_9AGAR
MGFGLDALDDLVKKELSDLQSALADLTQREALLELKGDEAQCKLDVLQLLLGDGPFGGGGFGDIWKGEIGSFATDRMECAVKIVRRYRKEHENAFKTHLREAILWRQLKHPNVLPFLGIYHLDNNRKDICLVSPFMENGHLHDFLTNSRPEDVHGQTLMYDIASGVEYLHNEDIIHGDLKEILRQLYGLALVVPERGRKPPPPQPANLPEDEGHIWPLLHECWQQEPSARPTATNIILRVLSKDVQVATAPNWEESLYTTIQNNIDFYPLIASMSSQNYHGGIGIITDLVIPSTPLTGSLSTGNINAAFPGFSPLSSSTQEERVFPPSSWEIQKALRTPESYAPTPGMSLPPGQRIPPEHGPTQAQPHRVMPVVGREPIYSLFGRQRMGGGNPTMMGMGGIGGGVRGGMPGNMAMGNSPMMSGMPGGLSGPGNMMHLVNLDREIAKIPLHLVLKVKQGAGVEGKDNLTTEEKRRVMQVYLEGEVARIPPHLVLKVKQDAGVEGKDNLTTEEKHRVMQVYRAQYAQRPQVGSKRSSASDEDAEGSQSSLVPDVKRHRPSPMDTQQSMPGAASYSPQQPSRGSQPAMMGTPSQQPGMPRNPDLTGMMPQPGQMQYRNRLHTLHDTPIFQHPGNAGSPAASGSKKPSRKPSKAGVPGGTSMMPPPPPPSRGTPASERSGNQMQYRNQMYTLHNRNMPQQSGNARSLAVSGSNEPLRKPSQPALPSGSMMLSPPPPFGIERKGTPKSSVFGNKDGIAADGLPRGNVTSPNTQGVDGPGEMPGGGMTPLSPSPGTPIQQDLPPLKQPIPELGNKESVDKEILELLARQFPSAVNFGSQPFRPEGDIDFERDFGQWFNHPDGTWI